MKKLLVCGNWDGGKCGLQPINRSEVQRDSRNFFPASVDICGPDVWAGLYHFVTVRPAIQNRQIILSSLGHPFSILISICVAMFRFIVRNVIVIGGSLFLSFLGCRS